MNNYYLSYEKKAVKKKARIFEIRNPYNIFFKKKKQDS